MLAHLLSNNRAAVLDEFRQKITDKDSVYGDKLGQTLATYIDSGDPCLIVIPNYADADFNHALLQGLNEALRKEGVPYVPATNYRRAADLLTSWKLDGSPNYTMFVSKLTNMVPDTFIKLLTDTDSSAYQTFKLYFKATIGVDFSEDYADDAYGVFAETAKELSKPAYGYRGIIVLYDEFGTMLSSLINSPEGKGLAVQEFLEKVKRTGTGANILFIAASHQDPATLCEDKKRDVTKVEGRFVRHQLDVTESEAEDILGTVFLHPDPVGFAALPMANYVAEATLRVVKHGLYPGKSDDWVTEKILKNLYPLHPLSAYLLPRLSGEFAQNTRSMFNFLSPNETKEGALAPFLAATDALTSDGRLNLFTPDRLLAFFEKNLAEARSEQVANWTDSYRTAIHKLTDAPEAEQLYRIILLLTIVGGRLQPKKDLLFWATGWPAAKRTDFDSLLNDLVVRESLEFNPTMEVYEFPMSGSKSVSKIILEQRQKLVGLSLADCVVVWDGLEARPNLIPTNQEDQFGANRYFRVVSARRVYDLNAPVDSLTRYYQGTSDMYVGNGLLFYLLAPGEADSKPMIDALQQPTFTQPYVFYAVPKDGAVFEAVQEKTLDYRALQETLVREEVKVNTNQQHTVNEQLRITESRLREAIKNLYQPGGWVWYCASEPTPNEFKSATGFQNWFDTKVDELFPASSVPNVREHVLWFKEAEKPSRAKALAMLWDADKGEVFLHTSDISKRQPDERILQNLFYKLRLTKDVKTISNKQYGDIKNPEANSAAATIFRHIDKHLKKGAPPADPSLMLAELLQAPFGLSRPLVLFMLTAYGRFNRDELFIGDAKQKQSYTLSADLFRQVVQKPHEYRMRRIDMPGPQKRYLDELRTLFGDTTATSFGTIGKQMTGMVNFLSPLQRTLITQEANSEVAAFYKSLTAFTEQFGKLADQDKESRGYLLEVLPDNLLGLSQAAFEDDVNVNAKELCRIVKEFKEFPGRKEREFRLETLTLMAKVVFGETLVAKEDIRKITEAWFGKLPPANRQATYEPPQVNDWITVVKNGPGRKDLLDVYLSELPIHPDKDWTGNLMQCQSRYVDEMKAYRKTVDEYTQNPLLTYQYIALSVFSKSKNECPDEATFAALFANWYEGLTNQAKAHTFEDDAVRIMLDNVASGLSVKQRFLEVIPTRWKDIGQLPGYLSAQWEDWSQTEVSAIAGEYSRCVRIIKDWKPAVNEAAYFTQIGRVFGLSDTGSADALREALTQIWLPTLPERTRMALWAGMRPLEARFMAHLMEGDFYEFITRDFPHQCDLPSLQTINEDALVALTGEVANLKTKIEQYRRPLKEVIYVLTKRQYETVADYQNVLYATIRETEAFENKAEKDSTLPLHAIPRLLLSEVRKNQPFDTVVTLLAEQLSLPTDHHTWSRDEQLHFVRTANEHLRTLQSWRFPEDRRMNEAKAELSTLIWKTSQSHGLSVSQMHKIVQEILHEQPTNGHA